MEKNSKTTLNIRLTFFGPYSVRLAPAASLKDRSEFRRFDDAIGWHGHLHKDSCHPRVNGKLIRSKMIDSLMEMFALFEKNNQIKALNICSGWNHKKDREGDEPTFLRHQPMYAFSSESECSKDAQCALCLIRGILYPRQKGKKPVWFKNLFPKLEFRRIEDLCREKTRNFCQGKRAKADSYFHVWEANHHVCSRFYGTIEIDENKVGNQLDLVRQLIAAGLAGVKFIAGAPCRIDIRTKENGEWQSAYHNKLIQDLRKRLFGQDQNNNILCKAEDSQPSDEPSNAETEQNDIAPELPSDIAYREHLFEKDPLTQEAEDAGKRAAKEIIETIKKHGRLEDLRNLATDVLDLRRKSNDDLEKLPREKRDTGKATLWGLELSNGGAIADCILDEAINLSSASAKNVFFKTLGQELFEKAKEQKVFTTSPGRLLGENEYYSQPIRKPAGSFDEIKKIKASEIPRQLQEWIITGHLQAETPFYFGTAKQEGNLIDLEMELDPQGHFKISYHRLRNALRSDLSKFVDGCDYRLGVFCDCRVCDIMSRCKPLDAVASDYSVPPEIRERIARDPQTDTVREGALFNQELGPQGLRFPFIMHYRSHGNRRDDNALLQVLGLWQGGMLWIGGDLSGKGRFRLIEPRRFVIDFSGRHLSEKVKSYLWLLENRNFMGLKKSEVEKALEGANKEIFPAPPIPTSLHWIPVDYKLIFENPVLINDPSQARAHKDTPDAIMFKKTVLDYNDASGQYDLREVFTIRDEGIKGVLRNLIGRNHNLHNRNHEDCTCLQCTLFGGEYGGPGLVRFEDADLVADTGEPRRIDHVSITWNGGVKGQAKFDDSPLCSKGGNNLLEFKGRFWVSHYLDKESKEVLRQAFIDLQNNMATIGANGGWGYGWVKEVKFIGDVPDWLNVFPEAVSNRSDLSENVSDTDEPEVESENLKGLTRPKPGKKYNPYYYVWPDKRVDRRQELVTHERYHNERLTGKLVCDLTTLSPLFVPDTTTDYAWEDKSVAVFKEEEYLKLLDLCDSEGRRTLDGLKEKKDGKYVIKRAAIDDSVEQQIGQKAFDAIIKKTHKSYRFFRINGKLKLPGSTISGPLSRVHQILTNSCFRNLEESQRLQRRMSATDAPQVNLGRVRMTRNGDDFYFYVIKGKAIDRSEIVRVPLYDKEDVTLKIELDNSKTEPSVLHNMQIAKCAENNRTYLKEKMKEKDNGIINGSKPLKFDIDKLNPHDKIAWLCDEGKYEGYLKFTGLNNPQKDEGDSQEVDLQKCYIEYNKLGQNPLDILLTNPHADLRPSNKYKYPRPVLYCEHEGAKYTLTKRCERIVSVEEIPSEDLETRLGDGTVFKISKRARRDYEELVQFSKENKGRVPEKFHTKIPNDKLGEGELVYFTHHEKSAWNLTPVAISRRPDLEPMGKRFMKGYEALRPCTRQCLEDCESCDPEALAYCFSNLPQNLCPTCSMWGTVNYGGRIGFSFASLKNSDGKAKWYSEGNQDSFETDGTPLTLKEQHSPRDTWPIPNRFAIIPGTKIYVNHPEGTPIPTANTASENNITIEPLAIGNTFRFEIVFRNLLEAELGQLLYTLELEPRMAHRIGKGKAFGMGSVQISVRDILVRDNPPEKDPKWLPMLKQKGEYIKEGKKALENFFETAWDKIEHIKSLRSLLLIPDKDIKISGLDGIEQHKVFKKNFSAFERQAILSTPWHEIGVSHSITMQPETKTLYEKIQSSIQLHGKVAVPSKKRSRNGKTTITNGKIKIVDGNEITFKQLGISKGSEVLFRLYEEKGELKAQDVTVWKEASVGPVSGSKGRSQTLKHSGNKGGDSKRYSSTPHNSNIRDTSGENIGTVKWFSDNKGYGFIRDDDKATGDVFVHFSDIKGDGYRTLEEDQRVTYQIIQGEKGPKAINVRQKI